VQSRDLARTRRWIADEERCEAERRVGEARRLPAPEWLIERGLDRTNIVAVHTGELGPGQAGAAASGAQVIEALRPSGAAVLEVPAGHRARHR
jgi:hypothetical protein